MQTALCRTGSPAAGSLFFWRRKGNLIITYDTITKGVNMPLTEGMIHAWLICGKDLNTGDK